MITVVVGGQFGSEGKGKVAGMLAQGADLSVRGGGPNAGHVFEGPNGAFHVTRSLPSGACYRHLRMAIGPGAVLQPDVLCEEIARFGLGPDRLVIDPRASLVTREDMRREGHVDDGNSPEGSLRDRIGSTAEGTGEALARRILDRGRRDVPLAGDEPRFQRYLGDVPSVVDEARTEGRNILLEGTQGFGLSSYYGYYPYVTSRDTSPAVVCSEVGVAPHLVNEVVMVVRTFPIRVPSVGSGTSGPMGRETTWEEVTEFSGSPEPIVEQTTVSKRTRRVALFDPLEVRRAVTVCQPTRLALTFVDYLNHEDRGVCEWGRLSTKTRDWIRNNESLVGRPFDILSTGPRVADTVWRRSFPW